MLYVIRRKKDGALVTGTDFLELPEPPDFTIPDKTTAYHIRL